MEVMGFSEDFEKGLSKIKTLINEVNVHVNPGSLNNILDLVLTNNDSLVEEMVVRPYAFDSDHHPLTFKLHAKMRRPDNVRRKVYCYKRADFQGLKNSLQSIPWDSVISDTCIQGVPKVRSSTL